jgi:hypothetical protein
MFVDSSFVHMVVHGWSRLTYAFLMQIAYLADIHKIPAELLINWYQTGVPLTPASNYTRAPKGATQVTAAGYGD